MQNIPKIKKTDASNKATTNNNQILTTRQVGIHSRDREDTNVNKESVEPNNTPQDASLDGNNSLQGGVHYLVPFDNGAENQNGGNQTDSNIFQVSHNKRQSLNTTLVAADTSKHLDHHGSAEEHYEMQNISSDSQNDGQQ